MHYVGYGLESLAFHVLCFSTMLSWLLTCPGSTKVLKSHTVLFPSEKRGVCVGFGILRLGAMSCQSPWR